MIHIGSIIRKELTQQERSVTWFARKLCCERANVYKIFNKQSLDTELLQRISLILNYDFFQHYSDKLKYGEGDSK
jgi:plasmid maintenance system antidote protein VapI